MRQPKNEDANSGDHCLKNIGLKLLGDRVLIREEQEPPMTNGGLYKIQKWHPPSAGIVVAIGTDVERRGLSLKVGQRVMIKPHGGNEFVWRDEKFRLLECAEILMVLSRIESIET